MLRREKNKSAGTEPNICVFSEGNSANMRSTPIEGRRRAPSASVFVYSSVRLSLGSDATA